MKTSSINSVLVALTMTSACGFAKNLGDLDTDGQATEGDGESSATATSLGEDDTGRVDVGADGESGETTVDPPAPADAVDILFVVDNSGSMGAEQGLLAAPLSALTEPLMQAGIRFRIAVTTTDNGNPWCPGTAPEAGTFVLSSCRSRLSDFLFQGATTIDAAAEGCLDVCALETLDIAATTTDLDPVPTPRPWIEWNSATDSNTPGNAPSAALSCAMPMGINGCGFEQPLESMHRALRRASQNAEPQFGFLRPDANLLVVFVTDEADCSHNPDQETIFLPEDDRTFWSQPDDPSPTSAVCWNAGTQCTGSSPYETCEPANLAPDGSPAQSEGDASLRPVSRYIGFLQEVQAAKTAGRVRVMGFVGRTTGEGGFLYADTTDQEFQTNFGIGPGCTGPGTEAVPPTRIRAVANAINDVPDEGLYSVCAGNYAPALGAMADAIVGWAP